MSGLKKQPAKKRKATPTTDIVTQEKILDAPEAMIIGATVTMVMQSSPPNTLKYCRKKNKTEQSAE